MRTLLMLVAAIGVASASTAQLRADEPTEVAAWVKKHGGRFTHHTSNNGGPGYEIDLTKSVTEEDLKAFMALKPTKTWYLNLRPCRDLPASSVKLLKDLPALEMLWLPVAAGDDEVKYVATTFPKLKELSLQETKVTDAGIKHLNEMKALTRLSLFETAITAAAIMDISKLKGLEVLNVGNTKITDNGVAKLKKALPKCDVRK